MPPVQHSFNIHSTRRVQGQQATNANTKKNMVKRLLHSTLPQRVIFLCACCVHVQKIIGLLDVLCFGDFADSKPICQ